MIPYLKSLHKYVLLIVLLSALTTSHAFALNILLVNDDGYQAEGINTLFTTLVSAGHKVTMVAPKEDQTGKGTSVVIQTGPLMSHGGTIELVNYEDTKWYLSGSPVDCVSAALAIVMEKTPPDLVISGPNQGENVGYTSTYSGTVGAAIRAIHSDIPAIAVSVGVDWDIYFENRSVELTSKAYPGVCRLVANLIFQLQSKKAKKKELLPEGVALSINYPVLLPEGKDRPLDIKYAVIDKYTTFGISYGFKEESPGVLVPGMWPTFENNYKEGERIPKRSEGKLFEEGHITISIIDGDLNSGKKHVPGLFKHLDLDALLSRK